MAGKETRNGCLKKSALPELSRACEKEPLLSRLKSQAVSGQAGTQLRDGMKSHCCTRLGDVAGGVLFWYWFVRRSLNQEHLAMILRNCWGSCSFWLLLAAACCRNKSRKSRRVHGFNKILNTGKQSLSPLVIFLKHLQLTQIHTDQAGKRTLLTILFPLQAIEGEQTNNKKIWAQETINQQQAPAYLSLSAWSLLGKALLTISSSLSPRKTK